MLFAIVSRGKNPGARLFPYRFNDDRYHVHLGKEGPFTAISLRTLQMAILFR